MSRIASAREAVPMPPPELPPEPADLGLSSVPTIKGIKDAAIYLTKTLGSPTAEWEIRMALREPRRLDSHLKGGALWFDTRSLWRYAVMGNRRTAVTR